MPRSLIILLALAGYGLLMLTPLGGLVGFFGVLISLVPAGFFLAATAPIGLTPAHINAYGPWVVVLLFVGGFASSVMLPKNSPLRIFGEVSVIVIGFAALSFFGMGRGFTGHH